VIEHGERLKKITVTYPERNTNWVIKECNGLATIGILFPELNVWGVNINTPNEKISLAINIDHEKSIVSINSSVISSFSTNAKVSVLRKPKGETSKYLGFYDFSEYRNKSLSFNTSEFVSLTIIKGKDKVLIFNPQENDIHCDYIIPLKKKIIIPPKKWVSVTSSGMTELDDGINLFGNSIQF